MSIEQEIETLVKQIIRNEMGDLRHRLGELEIRPVGSGGSMDYTAAKPGQFTATAYASSLKTNPVEPEPKPSGLVELATAAYLVGDVGEETRVAIRLVIEAVAKWLDSRNYNTRMAAEAIRAELEASR